MKMFRTTFVVLACMAVPAAFAQWLWVDKDGHKVFSDQAPPPDVPAGNILKRPGGRVAAPEAPAAAPAASAAVPQVSGKDKALEEKRKQAASAEAEKRKAQEEELAKARADNCERAKRSKETLDSGVRIVTTNDKGEREFIDDATRAAEIKRIEGVIARDCKS
jgi:type IV secretory pathway VirB10-like protein